MHFENDYVLHCSTEIASEDVEKLGVRWNWKIEKSQLRQMDSANSSSNSTERMAKTWGFTQNLGWQGSRLIWLKSDWCRRRRRCRRCVLFHDGITWERFELSSWFFAWWLFMTCLLESEFGSQFDPCRPARPTKSLFLAKNFHDGLTWPIFIRFSLNFVQRSLVSLWTDSECLKWLRPFFDLPARPTKFLFLAKNFTMG